MVKSKAGFSLSQNPLKGSAEALPKINQGQADLAVTNSLDGGLAYQGEKIKIGGRNPFPHSPNIRLVSAGPLLVSGFFVRKDSPFKTLKELRGKRIAGEFSVHVALWFNTLGYLINAGLGWSDVEVFPVKNAAESRKALIEAKVDGASFAVSGNKNADDLVGIKAMSLDCSAPAVANLQKNLPGYQVKHLKAGYGPGIVEDSCAIAYPLYIITHKGAPAEMITALTGAIYENIEALQKESAMTKSWEKESLLDANFTVPFHPAAIDYFKSKGLWSEAMNKTQKSLEAQL